MKSSTFNPLQDMTKKELFQIAERISSLRQDILNLTQSQFAAALDISQTYLSQIENKKKTVTPAVILKICSTYRVRMNWLIFNHDDNDIFQSEDEILKSSIIEKQEDLLSSLCSAFSLSPDDQEFLRWYLGISKEERTSFQKAVNSLMKLK